MAFIPKSVLGRSRRMIPATDILKVLRSVEARGRFEMANSLRVTIGQVFRYTVANGRANDNPTGTLKASSLLRRQSSVAVKCSNSELPKPDQATTIAPETVLWRIHGRTLSVSRQLALLPCVPTWELDSCICRWHARPSYHPSETQETAGQSIAS
jgi:hypothetical protein